MPVVACCLHSQVGVVAAAYHDAGGTGLVYVMTDGGALPLALSDLVAELVGAGLLAGTVSDGHAFGGTLEAVNVPSALTLARHALSAQAVVIGPGPGVVGTGTSLGNSGSSCRLAPESPSPGTSAPVSTQTTPGIRIAGDTSILVTRAWACGASTGRR